MALAVIQFYYVQEMVAALIVFSALFVFVSMTGVMLLLLEQAGQRVLVWAEKKRGFKSSMLAQDNSFSA